ncbi:MAG: hypothetical protein K0R26_2004 [Bacteroidota bacterium]|jgi:hypothetical protein|nr:hypothetical protein [Bacteroidota bacterium]
MKPFELFSGISTPGLLGVYNLLITIKSQRKTHKQGVYNFLDHVMYNISFKATGVCHNTMLEGYGMFYTTDKLVPISVYVLEKEQVKRLIYTANVTLSYTTRYGTLFYNWFAFSPETKLQSTKTSNPNSYNINLANRWHHFSEIGLSFNIH